MQELIVISGKGGTGKTSITAALAALAQPVVLADCDVDAPDLHILTSPQVQQTHPFSGGKKARIVNDACCGCGRCAAVCRFDAIGQAQGNQVVAVTYAVDPIACEGCGACVAACPADAIRFEAVENGQWLVSDTRYGPMIHARLHPGEENSGKLVSTVRRKARTIATAMGLDLILADGSPGVGCPVIASLTNAGFVLIVAEPTPSGEHDALRVIQLARQMHVPTALCVNRWDISPSWTERLESEATDHGVSVVGRVRDDVMVVEAQMHGRNIIEYAPVPVAHDIRAVWQRLATLLGHTPGRSPACQS